MPRASTYLSYLSCRSTVVPVIVDMAASSQASTLGAYIGLAALMGALSLLTPCVFPMVPITVSYFTNRAGKSRREAVIAGPHLRPRHRPHVHGPRVHAGDRVRRVGPESVRRRSRG